MKNFIKLTLITSIFASVIAPSAYAADDIEKICSKMAIEDTSVRARDVKDFIKACTSAQGKDSNGGRFTWDRGRR